MPIGRRKWIVVASIVVVVLVVSTAIFTFLIPKGPHPGFLSQNKAASVTGYNFTQITISNTNSHQYKGELMEYSAYFIVTGTSESLTILIFKFNGTAIASDFYWLLTSPEIAIPNAIVNTSFRGFTYTYLYDPMTNTTYGNIFNGWGIDKNYVFDLFAPNLMISNQSMVSLIEAQIEAMT